MIDVGQPPRCPITEDENNRNAETRLGKADTPIHTSHKLLAPPIIEILLS